VPAKPDGGKWACSFDDEFDDSTADASSLNRQWWAPQLTSASGFYTGPLGSQACYVDSPNNISVSGGALHLTARREAHLFLCGLIPTIYTAGMVSTIYSFSQTYGRFEIRALLPQTALPGLQETLWLWPVNDTRYGAWPASGEIDLSEFYSQHATTDVPIVHYDLDRSTVDPATNRNVYTNECPIKLSQYNDYALTWEPGTITVTVNGNTCLTDHYQASNVPSPAPFDQPFFIVLTQALGVQSNSFDPGRTPLPATTSVDYVRVWK
jgi:beta-glucanase (GH16 family)